MTTNRTVFFTKEFKKNVRKLSRKYRRIKDDLSPVITRLQNGEILGTRITGVKHEIYKMRLVNSSINKGKSGGFRLIYYLRLKDELILLTIYSKSDQTDISATDIVNIVNSFGQSK